MIRFISLLLVYGLISVQAQDSFPPVSELIEDLRSDERQERRDAARTLSMMREKASPATAELVKGLRDRDSQIWFHSVTALANMGPAAGDEAIPALIEAFRDSSRYEEQVRFRSAHALARMGRKVIPALREAMESSSSDTRQGVCMALGTMGPDAKDGYDLMAKGLRDESLRVRTAAAEAFGEKEELSNGTIPLLQEALKQEKDFVRASAAKAMARYGRAGSVFRKPLLAAHDAEGDEGTRAEHLRALAAVGTGGKTLTPLIKQAMLSSSGDLKMAALDALLYLKSDAKELNQLASEWLRSGDVALREKAGEILAVIGSGAASVVPSLMKVANGINDHGEAPWATNALVRIGSASIQPLLAKAGTLTEPAPSDAWWVASVAHIGPQGLKTIGGMVKSDKPMIRHAGLTALNGMGVLARPLLNEVKRRLADEVVAVKAAALKAYYSLGAPQESLSKQLGLFLRSEEAELQTAAAQVLQVMGGEGALLMEDVLLALQTDDSECRLEVVRAIGAMGRTAGQAVKPLGEMLESGSPELKAEILLAFSEIGPESASALKTTMALLSESDIDLKKAALKAMAEAGTSAGAAVEEVERLFTSGETDIRPVALSTLLRISGDKEKLEQWALKGLVSDVSSIRFAAVEGVGGRLIRSEKVVEQLIDLLKEPENHDAVFLTMRRLRPRYLDKLVPLLDSPHPRVRLYGVEAVTGLGKAAKSMAPKIREMARDPDEYVSRAARRHIKRLN